MNMGYSILIMFQWLAGDTMTDEETKEYWEFMFDPENILECERITL